MSQTRVHPLNTDNAYIYFEYDTKTSKIFLIPAKKYENATATKSNNC